MCLPFVLGILCCQPETTTLVFKEIQEILCTSIRDTHYTNGWIVRPAHSFTDVSLRVTSSCRCWWYLSKGKAVTFKRSVIWIIGMLSNAQRRRLSENWPKIGGPSRGGPRRNPEITSRRKERAGPGRWAIAKKWCGVIWAVFTPLGEWWGGRAVGSTAD